MLSIEHIAQPAVLVQDLDYLMAKMTTTGPQQCIRIVLAREAARLRKESGKDAQPGRSITDSLRNETELEESPWDDSF